MAEPESESVRSRTIRTVLLVGVPLVVVAAIAAIVIFQAGGSGSALAPTPAVGGGATAATGEPTGSPTGSPSEAPSPTTTGTSTKPSPTPAPGRSATASRSDKQEPQPTRRPVPLKTPTQVKAGLTAKITKLEAVQGKAQGPGEIDGPAVRFKLTLTNSGDKAVPLDTTVVNLFYGEGLTPGLELREPGGSPLPASVSPGGDASGTYIFVVPRGERGDVLITVDYSVDVSVTAFRGKAPS
jgi:hypothetical protein